MPEKGKKDHCVLDLHFCSSHPYVNISWAVTTFISAFFTSLVKAFFLITASDNERLLGTFKNIK
jgi:hypothetical protein